MPDWLQIVLFVLAGIVIARWLLPRFGVQS